MAEWTRSAKVGVFAIVLVGAAGGLYKLVGKTRIGAKGVEVYTTMHDATGLAPLSRINMAGIPVGNIKRISLTPDGRARIDIELYKDTHLHKDASIAKQTATLLSEPFLAVTPGSDNAPLLVEGDSISHVIEPVSTDQIMQDIGRIADRMKAVSESLASTLGSQQGEQDMKAILHNVEQATDALNTIARENQVSIRTTLQNLEEISGDARPQAKEILENVRVTTEQLRQMLAENRPNVHDITERTDRASSSLESAMSHVDSVTGRIDRGEGTIGKLTKDEALIDEVQGAAESVNDLVSGVSRLQTIVSLRTDYNFLSNTIKNYVEFRLQPREDKYYSFELVNDPRGKTDIEQVDVDTTNPNSVPHYREVRTRTTNGLRISAQFARRLGPFTGRFGIKESTGGLGLDLHLFEDRFELQQDLFGFSEQITPRWRVTLFYEFIKRLWLLGGVDNILFADRRDYFVGLNLRFNDEDLKSVLLFAPKSMLGDCKALTPSPSSVKGQGSFVLKFPPLPLRERGHRG